MRILFSILVSILMLAGTSVEAQGLTREQAVAALTNTSVEVRRDAASRLGDVGVMADVAALAKLLRDTDEDTRDNAEQSLWRIWARSGNPEVDRLFEMGVRQLGAGDLPQAIATFTRVIELQPDFAEGWNKRATLYFMIGELRKSLADCDEVIKRNPYHFGALAGYAQIFVRLEYYDRALDYSRRALAVNPNMEGVRRNMILLERLQEQRRRQVI